MHCCRSCCLTHVQITITYLDDWAGSVGVPTLPKLPPLLNATARDAIAQWAAANELSLPMPRIALNKTRADALRLLLPNFTMPALLLPSISANLFKRPVGLSLPVFTLPSAPAALVRTADVLPSLTSLPSLLVDEDNSSSGGDDDVKLRLTLPDVTIDGFSSLAHSVANLAPAAPTAGAGVMAVGGSGASGGQIGIAQAPPALVAPHAAAGAVASLDTGLGTFSHVLAGAAPGGVEVSFDAPTSVAQLMAGVIGLQRLPTLAVPSHVLSKLSTELPGLPSAGKPAVLLLGASAPYVDIDSTAAATGLPVLVVSDSAAPAVRALIPALTYAPTLLLPDGVAPPPAAAEVTLPQVVKPTFSAGVEATLTQMRGLGTSPGAVATTHHQSADAAGTQPIVHASGVQPSAQGAGSTEAPSSAQAPPQPAVQPQLQSSFPAAVESKTAATASSDASEVESPPVALPDALPPAPAGQGSVPQVVAIGGPAPGGAPPSAAGNVSVGQPHGAPMGSSSAALDVNVTVTPDPQASGDGKPESGTFLLPLRTTRLDEEDGGTIIEGAGPDTAYMDPSE